jgi:hypothetical protein
VKTKTHCAFRVDIWDDIGASIVEHVAGVGDFEVAEATYRAAAARWPAAHHPAAGHPSSAGGPQAVDDIWPGGSRHARNEWTPRALGKQPAAHFPSPCSAGYPGRSRNFGYALVFLKQVPARSHRHLSEWTVWVRSRQCRSLYSCLTWRFPTVPAARPGTLPLTTAGFFIALG